MIYRLYGLMHKTAKSILKRNSDLKSTVKLVSFDQDKFSVSDKCNIEIEEGFFINEYEFEGEDISIDKQMVYPVENLVPSKFDMHYPNSFSAKKYKVSYAANIAEAENLWPKFIQSAMIPIGYRNGGCYYGGYIHECQQWCLPSWIWTNAAIVRYYCLCGNIEEAKRLGDLIISQQQPCGGWIVRNDYSEDGVMPELAPNDSCYIALNCCLALYSVTKEERYLNSAKRNADWVLETARTDGMVYFGYNTKKKEWIKDRNIVDTGFTAGLFAKLVEITKEEKYKEFLGKFVKTYINIFYMPDKKCFATAIDGQDNQLGGAFGRGQGWALEGLIPAYRVLKDREIKRVISETIATLLECQMKNGGWSYNLLRPMMGIDCKGVPVIAKCMVEWYQEEKNEDLIVAAKKAMNWCARHTVITGERAGGIFSYTTEGAIVHHMYTSTALVYSSAYAAEVKILLDRIASL